MEILKAEHIYMPNKNVDLTKWAVIACDQFTSEPHYWKSLKKCVGKSASTLNLILPEVYLSKDNSKMINSVNANMKAYEEQGIREDIGKCFVLIDRTTEYNKHRLGLVGAIDLEEYSFAPNEKPLIRATEKTVIERIPPRVEIRKNASFELPHILLLIDDREEKIIENLYKNRKNLEKIYDFDLNMNGGHIVGYKVEDTKNVVKAFNKLVSPRYVKKTFNTSDAMMFAVGDGNHSLATAKTHWENIKANLSDEEQKTHPARYALVEIENIHDKGLTFNPIYRVVFDAKSDFEEGLNNLYKEKGAFKAKLIKKNSESTFVLPKNCPMAVKLLQEYIDEYISKNPNTTVDYVHGEDNLKAICKKNKKALGITLPTLNKSDLFEYVLKNGVLTRKTFSIGEATEKRYYIESHKIVK